VPELAPPDDRVLLPPGPRPRSTGLPGKTGCPTMAAASALCRQQVAAATEGQPGSSSGRSAPAEPDCGDGRGCAESGGGCLAGWRWLPRSLLNWAGSGDRRWCSAGVFRGWRGAGVRAVKVLAGRWRAVAPVVAFGEGVVAGQVASTQVPSWRASPWPARFLRLTAAVRRLSQALFLAAPR